MPNMWPKSFASKPLSATAILQLAVQSVGALTRC